MPAESIRRHVRHPSIVGISIVLFLIFGPTWQSASADHAMPRVSAAAADADRPVPTSDGVPPAPAPPPPPPPTTAVAAPSPPTTIPPPPTTIPPPPTTAPPTPPTIPAPAPAPPRESLGQRVDRAFAIAVPEAWRMTLPVRLDVIAGSTSWSHSDGRLLISMAHARSDFDYLVDIVAHEFGHQIAYAYGSRSPVGAAPAGWPAPRTRPMEAWADCVISVFTGRENPSPGLAPCRGAQLQWAQDWFAVPPSGHERTD